MADNGTPAHAPRSIKMKFSCACGTEFTADIYQAVNVTLEPQLLYRLLAPPPQLPPLPGGRRTPRAAEPFPSPHSGPGPSPHRLHPARGPIVQAPSALER